MSHRRRAALVLAILGMISATLYAALALAAPAVPAAAAPATTAPKAGAWPGWRAPQAAATKPGEWPGWRGPNRDGRSTDKGLLKQWPTEGPALLWKVTDIGKGFSSATVIGGKVFITGDVGDKLTLFAFDMDGKPLWHVEHDKAYTGDPIPGARATPVIDSGRLYILSAHGLLGCYDVTDGRRLWTRSLKDFNEHGPGAGYSESVLIFGNLAVVTPGGENGIVAFDKTTGANAWTTRGYNAPAHQGSCIGVMFQDIPMIIGGTGSGTFGVDARTGEVLWTNDSGANNMARTQTPIFVNGFVLWFNGYQKGGPCLKLDAAGGKVTATKVWSSFDIDCLYGGYIVDNGYIYGNAGEGWSCLDLATGKKMWHEKAVGEGSLCWADGMLYLFGRKDGLVALATCSPDGLQIKGQFKVQGNKDALAHPVVIGGRMYIRYDTNLYCFDVKAK